MRETSSCFHLPVMPAETLQYLRPRPGGTYVDCTLGGGGHAEALLLAQPGVGLVLGLDQDQEALAHASERLARFGGRFRAVKANFRDLEEVLAHQELPAVDGILMDLGVSSWQLTGGQRGFSFRADEPLDMRMDTSQGLTAADLVASAEEPELARWLREYGEERWAERIARFIVAERQRQPLRTTGQLAAVVQAAVPRGAWPPETHVATRTFQALRIAVNAELEALDHALQAIPRCLHPGGRTVVISYHSLEDRRVKRAFREAEQGCSCPPRLPICVCGRKPLLKVLTRRPVTPGPEAVEANPRARSAKLRAAERLSV